jgi:hypothetical protein
MAGGSCRSPKAKSNMSSPKPCGFIPLTIFLVSRICSPTGQRLPTRRYRMFLNVAWRSRYSCPAVALRATGGFLLVVSFTFLWTWMARAQPSPSDGRAGVMAPEPDYEAVTAREFQSMLRRGTREALLLFIARHPKHPLADRAREMLSSAPSRRATGSPDADVFADLNGAIQLGTAAAYDRFIGKHPGHPLADEARRRRDLGR